MSWGLISWQSIIAGVITTLAISIVLAVLGVALGFTVVKPKSDHPLSGLGLSFGIWSVISVIVSLAAGGFVAGHLSGINGTEHGFLVWATVLIAGTLFGGLAIGSAVRLMGSTIRGIGSGAASIASSAGESMSHLATSAYDHLKDSVTMDFDAADVSDEVRSVLKDTGVESLQPEYLKMQMQEAKNDLKSTLAQLRMDSDNYESIISRFLATQKDRLQGITRDVDKSAAVNALMNHRNLSRDEAEKTVDNALHVYNQAVGKAEQTIAQIQHNVEDAKAHLIDMTDKARIKADSMARTAARSAIAAAAALIIGAVISCYAGIYGSRNAIPANAFVINERVGIQMPMERTSMHRQNLFEE